MIGRLVRQNGDESGAHERPGDGAQRIARSVEPEGLASHFRLYGLGEHGVAQRPTHALAEPTHYAADQDDRPGMRYREQREAGPSKKVSRHHHKLAMSDAVRIPTRGQFQETGERIGCTFDPPQRRCRNSNERKKTGENGQNHLMASVGEKTGHRHAEHVLVQPAGSAHLLESSRCAGRE